MGTTLARAASWTSVEGTQGKLEYTSINEYILNEITQFVKDFSVKNPTEAKVVFKKPLEWTSENLTLSSFTGSNFVTNPNGSVSSTDNSVKGEALLSVKKKDNQSVRITALNLEKCAQVLQIAKDNKRLSETRSCLENNMDPIGKMLGEAFSTVQTKDNTLKRMLDNMIKFFSILVNSFSGDPARMCPKEIITSLKAFASLY